MYFLFVVIKMINFGCNIIRIFKEGSERQLFDHPCLFWKRKRIDKNVDFINNYSCIWARWNIQSLIWILMHLCISDCQTFLSSYLKVLFYNKAKSSDKSAIDLVKLFISNSGSFRLKMFIYTNKPIGLIRQCLANEIKNCLLNVFS